MSRPHITLGQIHERSAPKTFERGQDLYFKQAMFDTVLRGQVIEAKCEAGSQDEPYDVQATLDSNGVVDTTCTCLYDFGGDCKHATALLLTYLNSPDKFENRQPLADVLETREKGELVALIRQMVKRHPDLKDLIDRPMPSKVTDESPLDLHAFSKELHHAYRKEREWGRPGVETTIESVRAAALEFAEQKDWRSASSIYRLIIEECLAHPNYFYEDEEGYYGAAIDDVIQDLDVCLSFLSDDDRERQAILNSLIEFFTAHIDSGGDVGADVPDIILKYARPQDVSNLKQHLRTTIEKRHRVPYFERELKAFSELFIQLDLLNTTDPEAILTRLRNARLYDLLIDKLLELKRVDEAVTVIRGNMLGPQAISFQMMRLYSAGFEREATRFAEQELSRGYDRSMCDWLIDKLRSQDDKEGVLRWQVEQMKVEPSRNLYNALKASAEKLENWSELRPALIAQLEKGKYYGLLTQIYMAEELWDKAWATLPKVSGGNHVRPNQDVRLKIDLAEQSIETHPEKALPVLVDTAHALINQRNRAGYEQAARYLVKVRDAYDSMDEFEQWEKIIGKIRGTKSRLPALLEELKKVGL